MANTDTTKKKGDVKESNFFKKCVNFFKSLGLRIGHAFRDMWHELKKVTWPQRSELINYSVVVVAFMLVMGVVIFLIDTGAGALIQAIT
ncbi:MAG: preprotein translocase subunit SecE [Clostridia bacterium]|nr:preprotein translocase subunit SecE [Clostridia bacterium]